MLWILNLSDMNELYIEDTDNLKDTTISLTGGNWIDVSADPRFDVRPGNGWVPSSDYNTYASTNANGDVAIIHISTNVNVNV
jgi:hypothetical protein